MKKLDKEEFRIKLEEINQLVEKQDYKGAANVADSIDWRRVKNVRTLCVVGEIYAANKRYEDSKEIFLLGNRKNHQDNKSRIQYHCTTLLPYFFSHRLFSCV